MLDGIGIDIIDKNRFQTGEQIERVLREILTRSELHQSKRLSCRETYWSRLFACKEAILKAMTIGLHFGSFWQNILIDNTHQVTLCGKLLQYVKDKSKISISDTCAKRYAVSCALIHR